MVEHTIDAVESRDGTKIGYRKLGMGPGLVILHGGGFASQYYLPLAVMLAEKYTIYLPDARGRGLSGPFSENHGVRQEVEDIRAILEKSRARYLFGHSRGGVFALEAACVLPVERLALFEPPVPVDGEWTLPLDWIPAFNAALDRADRMGALIQYVHGLRLNGMAKLPPIILRAALGLLLRGQDRRNALDVVPTLSVEFRVIAQELERTLDRYGSIKAKVLLLSGSNSPDYFQPMIGALSGCIPGLETRILPGLDHSSPIFGPLEPIATLLLSFFE